MAKGIELTDLTAFVSFAESLETEPQLELSRAKSPKLSRQQSRIGGLIPYSHSQSTTPSGGMDPIYTGLERGKIYGGKINDLQMTEKEKEELMHTKTFLKIQQDIKNRQKRMRINAEKEKNERKIDDRPNDQRFYIDKAKQMVCAQGITRTSSIDFVFHSKYIVFSFYK